MAKSSIHRIFHCSEDYDEFAAKINVAYVEEKLLELGPFKGILHDVLTSHVIVENFNINKKVFQIGTGVPGYITFIIWDPKVLFSWRKHEMKKGMIGILWTNEHQSVSGAGFNGLPISVEENFFNKLCRNKGYPELFAKLKKNELLHVSEVCLIEIRQLVRFVTQHRDFNNKIINELIEDKLVGLLINCLVSTLPVKPGENLTYSKFVKIIDYIHSNLSLLTSVSQISEGINIPERTLRRLIQKNYNLSPKNYLNTLRLNEVRKGLKSDSESSNIFKVASRYNFWHMGQFTRDYKMLFGELPSETLKNNYRI